MVKYLTMIIQFIHVTSTYFTSNITYFVTHRAEQYFLETLRLVHRVPTKESNFRSFRSICICRVFKVCAERRRPWRSSDSFRCIPRVFSMAFEKFSLSKNYWRNFFDENNTQSILSWSCNNLLKKKMKWKETMKNYYIIII